MHHTAGRGSSSRPSESVTDVHLTPDEAPAQSVRALVAQAEPRLARRSGQSESAPMDHAGPAPTLSPHLLRADPLRAVLVSARDLLWAMPDTAHDADLPRSRIRSLAMKPSHGCGRVARRHRRAGLRALAATPASQLAPPRHAALQRPVMPARGGATGQRTRALCSASATRRDRYTTGGGASRLPHFAQTLQRGDHT